MKRLAIVVHRCHDSVAAGSEALAWQYARLLQGPFEVEVLTTTALDYVRWDNVLPEGLELHQGIKVRRFAVTIGRSGYWHELHQRLRDDHRLFCREEGQTLGPHRGRWTVALQEEFIRQQGPYSTRLFDYLETHSGEFVAILFITYVYPTTYFGLLSQLDSRKLLVPTLHDEPAAYLTAFRDMAGCAASLIWLTDAERRLGHRLWGDLPGSVVALPVDTTPVKPERGQSPYLLYCGRIDSQKGCEQLLQSFLAFKTRRPSDLKLVLTGDDHMGLPAHPDIDYRGHVTVEEKARLMAGAELFVMPSAHESFSIATLEAMGQGTPALVNGACPVLVDHVQRSGGGLTYQGDAGFQEALQSLLGSPERRAVMGQAARAYVIERYNSARVRDQLIQAIMPEPAAFRAA